MKYLFATSLAVLLASSSLAQAADVVAYQEPAPQAVSSQPATFNWTGFYAGGVIGYGDSRLKLHETDDQGYSGRSTLKPDGIKGGLYAGYNYQFANFVVLGLETDFLLSNVNKKIPGYWDDAQNFDNESSYREHWAGSTRIRVGYAFDRFLPYITGGVAYADHQLYLSGGKDGGVAYSGKAIKKTRTGWTLGAGLDYALTDHFILQGEYRYTDLGKKTLTYKDYDNSLNKDYLKYHENEFRLGVAYKF